jgi:hypothetical protein
LGVELLALLHSHSTFGQTNPLLLVVEGANDIEFLTRLAARLRIELPTVPDLSELTRSGRLIVVPAGGGDPVRWAERLAPLGLRQLHLYDSEQQPQTAVRQRAITQINARPGCRGVLFAKRSLENYLHPAAICSAGGPELCFGDDDPVAMLVAEQRFCTNLPSSVWNGLSHRARHRLANGAKHWLNRLAVEQMTAALLAQRDPAGELLGILQVIAGLVSDCSS